MEQSSYVYILASGRNGTLYTGVTAHLSRRIHQHRAGRVPGFTQTYGVKRLVWYGVYTSLHDAIHAEKQIKRWRRTWKLELIEKMNPRWLDLYETLNS
ncbi:MAG: GIY-YIG nuclease family protein [Phenylobacterium sp.]|uniref:GIY-YIG nuclease family protein n=1 Tax=Phenylobacterium sp. TaxID=1871053 RepID=UPI001B795A85|nr:GIY-YIG nuclease family protein [Phenylobacterium sp.]MBP7816617.1 GIY-YIG nuclease family protein [Phenylobacterium sp.]MBP9230004.1 GIY-YIG nuclease family protein [Phenylobacterium sp.]MBP9756948.1 GIY-YIG nuclease family protein [Phenylobacterium sp.]